MAFNVLNGYSLFILFILGNIKVLFFIEKGFFLPVDVLWRMIILYLIHHLIVNLLLHIRAIMRHLRTGPYSLWKLFLKALELAFHLGGVFTATHVKLVVFSWRRGLAHSWRLRIDYKRTLGINHLRQIQDSFFKVFVKPTINFFVFRFLRNQFPKLNNSFALIDPMFNLLVKFFNCKFIIRIGIKDIICNIGWILFNRRHIVIEKVSYFELNQSIIFLTLILIFLLLSKVFFKLLISIINAAVHFFLHQSKDFAPFSESI